jgi:hypothetical protein
MKKILGGAIIAIALSSCTVMHTVTVTNNNVGTKTGVAKGWNFSKDLDITAEKACKNGNISKIGTMEFTAKSFLILMKYETVITGE